MCIRVWAVHARSPFFGFRTKIFAASSLLRLFPNARSAETIRARLNPNFNASRVAFACASGIIETAKPFRLLVIF